MTKEITQQIDPVKSSLENLMAIVFPKSSSANYPLVVSICNGAQYCEEILIGKKSLHFVVFSKTREDAGRAMSLIDYISGWKGVQVFTGGKLVKDIWKTAYVLDCFLTANACKDWTAHCHRVVDDPFVETSINNNLEVSVHFISEREQISPEHSVKIDKYLFPCVFLEPECNLQKDHPASIHDQIQARAVEIGCDWCPFFDPLNFKKSES